MPDEGLSHAARSLPPAPESPSLPVGIRLRFSDRVTVWARGTVLIGGSPWKVSRISADVQALVRSLRAAGSTGVGLLTARQLAAGRVLMDRGFAEIAPPPVPEPHDVPMVIPALDSADQVAELLSTLRGRRVIVVDDGSHDPAPLRRVADEAGATITRHEDNRGPAAARNTGSGMTIEPLVAFIDADCLASSDWADQLLHHFADPVVGAVAPRLTPLTEGNSLLERYEEVRSSLDMGSRSELVRLGARLGFVPSAALVVRRDALGDVGFDETLRLGEDVDLVWRLNRSGWIVRYDPSVAVSHRTRARFRQWMARKRDYGSSAADLDRRHPGQLTPLRISAANAATLLLLAAGHPVPAVTAQVPTFLELRTALAGIPQREDLALRIIGEGLVASTHAVGQALRREWWPLGVLAIMTCHRARMSRAAVACMLAPVLWDWVNRRPRMDPVAFTAFRLLDDAAYGSGVLAAAVRSRSWRSVAPAVVAPSWLRRLGPSRISSRRTGVRQERERT